VATKTSPEQVKQQIFAKLALSDDQKNKLAQLQKDTTNPQQLRREAMKVLTDEQKTHLKNLREEADAKRAAEREQRQARMNKYFPANQRQLAESKNKELRARTEARRAAAQAAPPSGSAGPTPAPAKP